MKKRPSEEGGVGHVLVSLSRTPPVVLRQGFNKPKSESIPFSKAQPACEG